MFMLFPVCSVWPIENLLQEKYRNGLHALGGGTKRLVSNHFFFSPGVQCITQLYIYVCVYI